MSAPRQSSLRAPTRGSTGAEHTSAPSRRCSFLQEAAQKVSEQLPHLAAELMATAHVVARENNLPRGVFKGVSCCVACAYPSERTQQIPCELCEYHPRQKRTRGGSRSRSRTKAAAVGRVEPAVQLPTASGVNAVLGDVNKGRDCDDETARPDVHVSSKARRKEEGDGKEAEKANEVDEANEEEETQEDTAPPRGEQHTTSLLLLKKKKRKKKKLGLLRGLGSK
mmetsp:Transcript_10277/g.25179  ORF Transcript_10277/g.25179 Transcript_10277/m.25179 type:complete len:224 (+) Transcript_10277:174-845(+)